ncbi:MFS transporter [Dactylosporangium sp. CA-233914]|uniref:MFS transporter n=1 Tax=Dactylosporangium sp. CA-233914 TaxID=3239934 RepID=UPI003D915F29
MSAARLLIAATLARTADSGAAVVIVLASVRQFGGPAQGSLVLAMLLVPHVVAGPFVGVVTDRARRPGLAHAVFVGVFGAALGGVLSLLGRVPQPVVLALALVAGCCGSMVFGGLSSRLDDVVAAEDLRRFRGLDAATYNVADIFGPAAGAALVVAAGAPLAAAVLAVSCLSAAVLLLTVHARPAPGLMNRDARTVPAPATAVTTVAAAAGPATGDEPADKPYSGVASHRGRDGHEQHGGDRDGQEPGRWEHDGWQLGDREPEGREHDSRERDDSAHNGREQDGWEREGRRRDGWGEGGRGRAGWEQDKERNGRERDGGRRVGKGTAAVGGVAGRGRLVDDLRGGFRAIVVSRPLRAVTAATCVAMFGQGMMPSIAVLLGAAHGRPAGGGLLVTAIGVGALAGSLLMARWPVRVAPQRLALVCLVVIGAVLGVVAFVGSWVVVVALFAVAGLFDGPLLTSVLQVRSNEAPPRVRTQVFTLGAGFKLTAAAVGAAVFAVVAAWPVEVLMAGLGGSQLVAAAVGVLLLAGRRRVV